MAGNGFGAGAVRFLKLFLRVPSNVYLKIQMFLSGGKKNSAKAGNYLAATLCFSPHCATPRVSGWFAHTVQVMHLSVSA